MSAVRRQGDSRLRLVPCALAGLLVSLLQVAAAQARPAEVLLLRHGHKPGERVNGMTLNTNLSARGWRQAQHLAEIIPACFVRGRPLRLASYRFDPITGKNARSYQTLVPLAVATGATIRVYSDAESGSEADGRQLLADPANDGALVVIAWEHRHLPELARGLGWEEMTRIDDDDFDSLWLLRYPDTGGAPQITLRSQMALDPLGCARGR